MPKLSSLCFVAPLCLLAAASAACVQNGSDDDDGAGGSTSSSPDATSASGTDASGTGGAGGAGGAPSSGAGGDPGTTTSSGTGGAPAGEPGWTLMPLLDEDLEGGLVFREGNDLVTGIHFTSVDDGLVVTTGDNQSFSNGGAIFRATQKAVTEVLFSGNRNGLCLLGTIDFHGLERSPDGFYALAHACDTIASHDGGATFDIAPNGVEAFGIERVLAIRHRADEVLAVHDGYVTTTTTAPGPGALWDDVWAPEAIPPTPNPVPDDQCEEGPRGMTPFFRTRASVSADGGRIAYGALQDDEVAICVSQDGGRSFFPKRVAGLGDDAAGLLPNGVVFATATTGIAFWASYIYPGQQWIARTTDGGETWAQVPFPADVADEGIELRSAFFAPDGQNGWIVGASYDHGIALLLKTTDGGATWERSGGDLAAKVSQAGGMKLHTGFALDANHIWVGGEDGVLLANEAGGE